MIMFGSVLMPVLAALGTSFAAPGVPFRFRRDVPFDGALDAWVGALVTLVVDPDELAAGVCLFALVAEFDRTYLDREVF